MKFYLTALIATLLLTAGQANAQQGVADQISPPGPAWLFSEDPANVWQQQVRVGVAGRLEAFEMLISGVEGASLDIRLRLGDGWNVGPVVWETTFTKELPNGHFRLFYVDHVGLHFDVGDTFVIEAQGNGTITSLGANYIDPMVGPPDYPENLYLSGPGCYSDCGMRLMFRTWMDTSTGFNYCLGSENSTGAAAQLSASGSNRIAANDLMLALDSAPPGQIGIVFYGPERTILPAGNGFLCVGGGATGLARLPFGVIDGAGTMNAAVDYLMPPTPTTQIAAGSTWCFQAYFRDPAGGGTGINFSDALEIVFRP